MFSKKGAVATPAVTPAPAPIPSPIVPSAPVYQFVSSIDFSEFNRLELPTIHVQGTPAQNYGPPAASAAIYGPPAQ